MRPAPSIAILLLAICSSFPVAKATEVGDEALRIVDSHTITFNAPARLIPSDKMVDGPLLGNGDLGVTIAGNPEALRFHIGKNDFWGVKTQSPQTVGRIELLTPELAGAPYKAVCDMRRARWTGDFAKDGAALRIGAFVDANANQFFVSLENTGSKPLTLTMRPIRGAASVGAPQKVDAGDKPALFGCEQHGGGRWHFSGETSGLSVLNRVLSDEAVEAAAKAPRGEVLRYDGRTSRKAEAPAIGDPLTIMGWVKADAFGEANYLVSQGEWSKGYSLGFSGGHLRFSINGTSLQTGEILPTGQWIHVAAIHDGTRMAIYLDGRLTESLGGDAPSSSAFLHDPDGTGTDVRSVALAARILGTEKTKIVLAPGEKATLAAAILSDLDAKDPLAAAKAQVADLTPEKIAACAKAHEAWWDAFWSKSFVEIPDKVIEKHWYSAQYILGSCSRPGKVAPGLWGNWITMDSTAWHGDFHLNYNFQAPFYSVFSANRPELAQPFFEAMNQSIPRGKRLAKEHGWQGLFLPVSIGPWGMCPEGDASDHGQRSNTAYSALLYGWNWRATHDKAWLEKTGYPYMREVAAFWTDYLKLENGPDGKPRYVIPHDAIHEGSGGAGRSGVSADMNPLFSLGAVRALYRDMLDMSEALGVDADLRPKWKDILEKISAFPTQERGGKTVFRYAEQGTAWWGDNTLGIQHIYPAGGVGLDSDPKLLEISKNMIDAMGRWNDYNGSSSWYAACARVGYDPAKTLAGMRRMYDGHSMPNKILYFGGGGIENVSPAAALDEMLMQSHEGVLRLFPAWPKDQDARFGTLRADGAFLVCAQLKGGEIGGVRIESEKGMDLSVQNPWPGKSVAVSRGGKPAETVSGDRFTLKTSPGEILTLAPAALSHP